MHARLSGRELLLIFLFWTSLATLSAVNTLIAPRGYGLRLVSPAGPIAMAYAEAWLWAAVTPLIFRLSSEWTIERTRWWVRIPMLVLAGCLLSLAIYFILGFARTEIFEVPRRGVSAFAPLREVGRFRFLNQLFLYFAVLAAGYAREYFLRNQERQREAAELRAQLADARLEALRAQLHPHFLFNTLNAISALVERDPAGARRMIARLSELLRAMIESGGGELVPLRQEIEVLKGYIEIMEIRFQGRLRVAVNVDPGVLDLPVPALVLQPLLENALEHGANRTSGESRVEVEARRDPSRLRLIVRDNGPGVIDSPAAGVGLTNTRDRLAQLYGSRASLTLASAPGAGAIATITIPIDD